MMPNKTGYLFFLSFDIIYLHLCKQILDIRSFFNNLFKLLCCQLHSTMIKCVIRITKFIV